MQPKFETGQVVYDKRGNPGRYLFADHHGHVVMPYYDDDGDFLLERMVWREVYEERRSFASWIRWVAIFSLIVAGSWLAFKDVVA